LIKTLFAAAGVELWSARWVEIASHNTDLATGQSEILPSAGCFTHRDQSKSPINDRHPARSPATDQVSS